MDLNQGPESKSEIKAAILDRMNIAASNRVDMTKKSDYKNKVIILFNNRANFLKKLVFLDKIITALNQANTKQKYRCRSLRQSRYEK